MEKRSNTCGFIVCQKGSSRQKTFYNASSSHRTNLKRKTEKPAAVCHPPPWRFDPFILVFEFGRRAETTACRPPVVRSDLAASLRWPPPHLSYTEQSSAGQNPGTKREHKALIQANTSYFMRVSRRAGSQRRNRMFLARFIMYQMPRRQPELRVLFVSLLYDTATSLGSKQSNSLQKK